MSIGRLGLVASLVIALAGGAARAQTPRPVPVAIGIVTTPQNDFEVLATTPGEVFLVWRLVNGRPGNPGALIEKAHKVKTTTRFFHTLEKMYAAGVAGAAPVQRSRSR